MVSGEAGRVEVLHGIGGQLAEHATPTDHEGFVANQLVQTGAQLGQRKGLGAGKVALLIQLAAEAAAHQQAREALAAAQSAIP